MDYEKKYKEAQGWIEKIYPTLQHEQQMEAEAFFPELKESEDEKIRKEIINIFHSLADGKIPVPINFADIFTWLEKQGETSTILSNSSNIGNVTLSEEEQNRFAKCVLTSCASSFIDYLDAHKYEGKMCVSNGECEDIENAFHNAMWDRLHRYYCKYIEKQGEQKPASKVEPKFKVGDWIVTRNGNVNQVIAVDKDGDGFTLDDDTYFCGPCKDSYWTIQDAKDGDVLAGKIDGDNYILIFKQIKDGWVETYGHYYDAVDRFCVPSQLFCRDYKGTFHPATKEQRDALMKAMTDAGWEFDFEKKELKKISQRMLSAEAKEALYDKPAWSEGDDQYLLVCKNALAKYQITDKWDASIISRWLENKLKSSKHQSQVEPSEEQIKTCKEVYADILSAKGFDLGTVNNELNRLEEQLKKLTE